VVTREIELLIILK